MKEIIYIQAGRLSNYTGTHFWNTQQCYLPSNDGEDVVDSKVSFCESRDEQVRITYVTGAYIFATLLSGEIDLVSPCPYH